jgi:hypothetical protein
MDDKWYYGRRRDPGAARARAGRDTRCDGGRGRTIPGGRSPFGAGAQRLASRPIAGLDPAATRHRAGIEGLAADRAIGIGPGERPGASRRLRHVGGIERLAVEPSGTMPAASGAGIDGAAIRLGLGAAGTSRAGASS